MTELVRFKFYSSDEKEDPCLIFISRLAFDNMGFNERLGFMPYGSGWWHSFSNQDKIDEVWNMLISSLPSVDIPSTHPFYDYLIISYRGY